MSIFRTDHNTKQLPDGTIIEDEEVQVDVTAEVIEKDLYDTLRTQYGINRTFIGTPNINISDAELRNQTKRLCGQMNALMRIAAEGLRDLLTDETVD